MKKEDRDSGKVAELKKKRIAVLMGGPSSEREVSLETGKGVAEALLSLGYDVVPIDWTPQHSLPAQLESEKIEVVWNALHGTCGEDGAVQGLLACMNIPCTGAGILSSALAMDKVASKSLFASHKIPTPKWQLWNAENPSEIALPLVVKPSNEGSSVGVSLVMEEGELEPALALAGKSAGPIMVEEYIAGHEVFVGILDEESLGTIEVRTPKSFYDYEAKYLRDDTEYLIPATLAPDILSELEELALRAHKALGCESYSRVDIRVREDGKPFVLEVNTLPGMTGSSLIPKLAKKAGISYPELCERILVKAR